MLPSSAKRLVDQIVIVQQAPARLLVLITLQNLVGDGEERGGTIATDHGAQTIQQCANASLLRGKTLDQAGVLDRLGDDCFARRTRIAGAKDVEIGFDAVGARQGCQQPEPPRLIRIALCRPAPRRRRAWSIRADAMDEPAKNSSSTLSRVSAGLRPSARDSAAIAGIDVAGLDHPAADGVAAADRARARRRETSGRRPPSWRSQARGRAGRRDPARRRAARASVNCSRSCVCSASSSTVKRAATLASNGNWWRSRVQKAWMVCTFSPPGVSSARANNRRASARRAASGAIVRLGADHVVERRIVERGPCGERVEHALGHIGGGGLGEGDAEDFLRLDALEQEIDHALRQHMGLARAGIGGDPRRYFRIGHRALQLRGPARE